RRRSRGAESAALKIFTSKIVASRTRETTGPAVGRPCERPRGGRAAEQRDELADRRLDQHVPQAARARVLKRRLSRLAKRSERGPGAEDAASCLLLARSSGLLSLHPRPRGNSAQGSHAG